ncbi:PLD nuclease N-terminal domain-containing protein [Agromyces italicus]|uniref:PLD nuclease N-terminal domain-containing protein n=1 Tax=Agromyces italicus TaxID=279572 RepID=UPI0003B50F80|nr:PLD nuclease N-terminal domain-containing protein [Agromyces italicus]
MAFDTSFWDVFSGLFGIFVFVAYLVALFSVIADLFRDPKLAGWAKAIWLLFLIFVPFLTLLVYLIARGGGFAERENARRSTYHEYVDDRGEVSQFNPNDEVAKAQGLGGDPTISGSQFDAVQRDSMREG